MSSELFYGDYLDVLRTIPNNSVDCILTDPPYGTTACKWDFVIPFEPMWAELKRVRKDRAAVVLFGSEPFSSHLRMSNIKEFKYDWVWDKANSGSWLMAKIQPLKIHEIISVFFSHCYYPVMTEGRRREKRSYGSRKGSAMGFIPADTEKKYSNLYYPKTIIECSNASQRGKSHATQKPVALLEYLIQTYTREGETVLDFTMGSGSVGVACANTGRRFIGIEKDAEYFEMAKKRIDEASK